MYSYVSKCHVLVVDIPTNMYVYIRVFHIIFNVPNIILLSYFYDDLFNIQNPICSL